MTGSVEMEDSLRPTDDTFKAFYEHGYRVWYTLWKGAAAAAAAECSLSPMCLRMDRPLFPQHPVFPVGVDTDELGIVTAKSSWISAGDCDLAAFEQTFQVSAAVSRRTSTVISDDPELALAWFGEDDGHTVVLFLAWAYALSARWTEMIGRASPMEYTTSQAPWAAAGPETPGEATDDPKPYMTVDLGNNLTSDAARWWTAVLAPGTGWRAAIPHERWQRLSPWSVTREANNNTTIVLTGPQPVGVTHLSPPPATFEAALQYIDDYSILHGAATQSRAALAAALHLPLANFERRTILLHAPQRFYVRRRADKEAAPEGSGATNPSAARMNPCRVGDSHDPSRLRCQLDRLLTLSANATGMKAMLGSVFYEPGIPANACGAWLQGTMAVLKTNGAADNLTILGRMLFDRSPHISYLWLGGIITGAHMAFLRNTHDLLGLNRIDLHEAAWTGTLHSFVQEPTVPLKPDSSSIARADECRLMLLAQEPPRENPPMYPYPPLGDTAIQDTDLGVQLHAHCPGQHRLQFSSITWNCIDGTKQVQTAGHSPLAPRGPAIDDGWVAEDVPVEVDYAWLDREADLSEGVTRSLFTWMRDMDGFAVAERDILRHEWIDAFDSSDDDEAVCPEGDGFSLDGLGNSSGSQVGYWLARVVTSRRRNSV
ncbi:hypothetical protein CSHISOI_06595 [Colletotrichum shisoi]|uniref:Uncharacterized protein n=1 Tax=Colletotrichum shisoi TaxID=2078593 RepID=A0A5Q4BQ90_9PEZI|nr:hypothetical protein CSHISOI_06595 [Colletotrichum shisoi]